MAGYIPFLVNDDRAKSGRSVRGAITRSSSHILGALLHNNTQSTFQFDSEKEPRPVVFLAPQHTFLIF